MVLDDIGHIEGELGHSQNALEGYKQALELQQAVGTDNYLLSVDLNSTSPSASRAWNSQGT